MDGVVAGVGLDDLGAEKQTEWAYTTDGEAAADGDDWRVRWNPATVAPGLDAGPLSYSTPAPAPAARVLDRTGADLLTQHIVTLVDITGAARTVYSQYYMPFEAFITAGLFYLVLTFTLVRLFKMAERRYLAYLAPRKH